VRRASTLTSITSTLLRSIKLVNFSEPFAPAVYTEQHLERFMDFMGSTKCVYRSVYMKSIYRKRTCLGKKGGEQGRMVVWLGDVKQRVD
jgi:hypothetical protein